MFAFVRDRVLAALRVPGEPHDPVGDSLLVFRAGEGYYRYRLAVFVLLRVAVPLVYFGGFAAFIAHVAKKIPGLVVLAVALAVLVYLVSCVVSLATIRLDYELRWYKVTDRSLRIREGVWFVREMTMSFANIQNVSIVQGPIQKYFAVADLLVESAGGGGAENNLHTGYFRGIAEAETVKTMILDRLRRHRDAGLGDHDDKRVTMEDVLREVRDEARALHLAAVTTARQKTSALRSGPS